jgi:hypothetical protein
MAKTKDLGIFYWHGITYSFKPKELIEKAETQEIESPFRHGRGVALRLPLSKRGVVVGKWSKTGFTEGEALTYAINGRSLTKDEVDWDNIRLGAANDSNKVQ